MNGTGLIFSVPTYNNSTAGSANMLIDSNGIFYRATSSLKYKTDVKDAVHGLEKVMQLRPVTYKGKAEADRDKVFGGLIAEEVDAVGLNEFVVYADDGTPDALAYGNMVSLCIKAIQELKAEVDSLKSQLNGA
jgi:multimeric flavodoxin WrbA